jgi:hypothetical protein
VNIDAASLKQISAAVSDSIDRALRPLLEEIASLRRDLQELEAPRQPAATAARSKAPAVAPKPKSAAAPTDQTCLVPKCPAPVLAKDLCETHYRIMRRSLAANEEFDLEAQRPARVRKASRVCSEAGCDEAHYAKGLCRRHYMAERSRIRNAARQGKATARVARPARPSSARATTATSELATSRPEPSQVDTVETEHEEVPQATGVDEKDTAEILKQESLRRELGGTRNPFEKAEQLSTAPDGSLPTAEMVSRVVAQYRGGLDRVAEVLGRNKRTLIDLLDHLDLMPYVARVRGAERQRVENSSLKDRLNDLLFREKLLEDLGCLKEVDERTGFEVKMRCADLAKKHETIEDALQAVASEYHLEEAGMKRLIWRYDLRRYLRGLGLKSPTQARVRA